MITYDNGTQHTQLNPMSRYSSLPGGSWHAVTLPEGAVCPDPEVRIRHSLRAYVHTVPTDLHNDRAYAPTVFALVDVL